jgi:hypothetical protein
VIVDRILPSKSLADDDDRELGYVCTSCGCVDGNVANGCDLCGDCADVRVMQRLLRLRIVRLGVSPLQRSEHHALVGRLLPEVRR